MTPFHRIATAVSACALILALASALPGTAWSQTAPPAAGTPAASPPKPPAKKPPARKPAATPVAGSATSTAAPAAAAARPAAGAKPVAGAKPAAPTSRTARPGRAPVSAAPAVTTANPAVPAPGLRPKPAAAAAPATPPALAGLQPTLLGQYADWGAYKAEPSGRKQCFVIAKPKASEMLPAARRSAAYLFISSRPAENVRGEVSVISGYPFKPASDATAEIGTTAFAMYTQNDGAWIKNVAEEPRMLDAMRTGGSDLVVRGETGRSKAADTFSLKGLSQALDRADQECKPTS